MTVAVRDLLHEVRDEQRAMRIEQQRQGAIVDRILAAVERGLGPRDQADADLLVAIKERLRDMPFTSAHVLQLAEADAALREALDDCVIVNAKELGHLLKRLAGIAIGGVRIVRVDADHRDGIVWRCELCEM